MTTQHTPGPWKARSSDMNPARVWITQDAPPNIKATPLIAQCAEGNPQAEANARLIAAAPDLMAALEHLMRYDFGDSAGAKEARAAIAKAKGGAE